MLWLRNLLLPCFLLPLIVAAQEAPESSLATSGPQDQQQSFIVELTEIEHWTRHQLEHELKLDAKELIRESRKNGSDRNRNILRVSAVEGIESYAQFGKRIPVVVRTTTSKDGTEYGYEDENVGTEIRVTVTRFDEALFRVELSFASSDVNLRPDGTKDDVDIIAATATHTVELGIPVIVAPSQQHTRIFPGGQSEFLPRDSSVLILSVEAAEQNKAVNRSTQKRGN
jgi:hypothetical protein